ncbi:MAG: GNAT family protein [Candidatus Hydrogenedentota bacterium]
MILHGKTITFRPWKKSGIPSLVKHANNPNVARNLRNVFPHPYTQSDAEEWLALCHSMDNRRLAIELEGEAIGGTGGQFKEDVHYRTFEIGYWLGEAFWDNGLISEAVNLICDHLFNQTDCLRIEAHVSATNPASARVLIKNGFQLEGTLRNGVFKNGEITDILMHSKIRL